MNSCVNISSRDCKPFPQQAARRTRKFAFEEEEEEEEEEEGTVARGEEKGVEGIKSERMMGGNFRGGSIGGVDGPPFEF
jgi:hypothetical protein